MRMKIVYYYLSNIVRINTAFIYCDNLEFRDIINFLKYYRPFNLFLFMSFYLDIFYINKFIIEFINPNLKITSLDTKRLLYTIVLFMI